MYYDGRYYMCTMMRRYYKCTMVGGTIRVLTVLADQAELQGVLALQGALQVHGLVGLRLPL